jgi:hypothetical protein
MRSAELSAYLFSMSSITISLVRGRLHQHLWHQNVAYCTSAACSSEAITTERSSTSPFLYPVRLVFPQLSASH